MPRIVAVPDHGWMTDEANQAYAQWLERGDASSTHDLCVECARLYETRFVSWPLYLVLNGGEPLKGRYFGEVGVEHPPYAGGGYTCTLCHRPLTSKDD